MAKGIKTGGGSRKGKPNRVTGALKDMILDALDKAGGVDYLKLQALETPTAFLALVGKVLPLQVTGDKDNPLHVEHSAAAREKVASGIAELAARLGARDDPKRPDGRAVH